MTLKTSSLHAAALALLLHAAYSAYEYHHLALLNTQLVLQSLLALVLATIAASLSTPALRPISVASEMRRRSLDQIDLATHDVHYGNNKASVLFGPS